MTRKEAIVTMLALAAIVAVSIVAYRSVTHAPPDACQICRRTLHRGVTYHLDLAKETEEACCPRCGIHFELEHPGAVRQARATDLNSDETIPAQSAVYVEGGDVEYCTMGEKRVEREPEGVSLRAYDRCLPSLVAFKSAADAESYRAQHSGRILSYTQAVESVRGHGGPRGNP